MRDLPGIALPCSIHRYINQNPLTTSRDGLADGDHSVEIREYSIDPIRLV
jgi:hypothetical protein